MAWNCFLTRWEITSIQKHYIFTCISPGTESKWATLFIKGEIININLADAVNLCWSKPLCISIVLQHCPCVKSIYCTGFTIANAGKPKKRLLLHISITEQFDIPHPRVHAVILHLYPEMQVNGIPVLFLNKHHKVSFSCHFIFDRIPSV